MIDASLAATIEHYEAHASLLARLAAQYGEVEVSRILVKTSSGDVFMITTQSEHTYTIIVSDGTMAAIIAHGRVT